MLKTDQIETAGINHLGLTVRNLKETTGFFTEILNWEETGFDPDYPRTAVSDGQIRLTLWQAQSDASITGFNRKQNIGLHHLALAVSSEGKLEALAKKLQGNNIEIEFFPELVGKGPRKHMMVYEPGGLRIEFIWDGVSSDE